MEGPLKFVELGIVAFVGTLFTAVGIATTVHALRQQFTWPKVPARGVLDHSVEVVSLRDTWSVPVLVVGMLGGLSVWKFWLDPLW